MSSPGAPGTVTSTGPAGPRPDDRGDPVARIGPEDVMTAPFAGQPGHGSTAFVRNQPARIADGRFQAGSTVVLLQTPAVAESTEVGSTLSTEASHVVTEISLSRQRICGPYTAMAAVLAAYDQHLGLTTAWRRS